MEFTLTHPDTGPKTILILFDGVPYETDSTNPWWDEIVQFALSDDPRVLDLVPVRPIQQPSRLLTDEEVASQLLSDPQDQILDEILSDPEGEEVTTTTVSGLVERLEKLGDSVVQLIEERDAARQDSDDWETLYESEVECSRALREKTRAALNERDDWKDDANDLTEDVAAWIQVAKRLVEESQFLADGLKVYASHAWPEIERKLEELFA